MRRRTLVGVLLGLALVGTGCRKRVAVAMPDQAARAPEAAPMARKKETVLYVLAGGTMIRHEESGGKLWFSTTPALLWAYVPNFETGALGSVANFPQPVGEVASDILRSPTQPFAFIADWAFNQVRSYRVNVGSRHLDQEPASVAATAQEPIAMALTPDGHFLYVASMAKNVVDGYAVDAANGALRRLRGSPFATGGTHLYGCCVAVTPDGREVLTADADGITSFRVDGKTGALTRAGWIAGPPAAGGLAIDPSGAYVYVVGSGMNGIVSYSIDRATGRLGLHALSQMEGGFDGALTIVLTPDGRFAYTVEEDRVVMYRLEDGRFTGKWGVWWPARAAMHLAVDPSGRLLFAVQAGKEHTVSVWKIDGQTGKLTAGLRSPNPVPGAGTDGFAVVAQ